MNIAAEASALLRTDPVLADLARYQAAEDFAARESRIREREIDMATRDKLAEWANNWGAFFEELPTMQTAEAELFQEAMSTAFERNATPTDAAECFRLIQSSARKLARSVAEKEAA